MPTAGKISNEQKMTKVSRAFGANWTINNLPLEAINAAEHYVYYYNAKKRPPAVYVA